jgi:FolB domain-containing protein
MSDLLCIDNIKVSTLIGFYKRELKKKQNLLISLKIQPASFAKAAASDRIRDAIDHHELSKEIIRLVSSRQRNLIETVAQEVVDFVLLHYPAKEVTVRVEKPNRQYAHTVYVEITRRNKALKVGSKKNRR